MNSGNPRPSNGFKPGEGGRPKGAPNKITRDIKEVIRVILARLTDVKLHGLVDKLYEDKPEAISALLGKLAPKDLTIRDNTERKNPYAEALKKPKEAE